MMPLVKTISLFPAADMDDYVSKPINAQAEGDFRRLEYSAHTLLGSSVYLTTRENHAPLQELETRARAQERAGLEELSQAVGRLIEQLADEVKQKLERTSKHQA